MKVIVDGKEIELIDDLEPGEKEFDEMVFDDSSIKSY